jgi:hypothetical protein
MDALPSYCPVLVVSKSGIWIGATNIPVRKALVAGMTLVVMTLVVMTLVGKMTSAVNSKEPPI